ncbi:hypothetical protein [Kosakonia arachidis]|nr:hypothetical protein [Kosakonia arachidis]
MQRYLNQGGRCHETKIAFLGLDPHTPLIEAVRTTLIGQGCINQALSTQL